MNPSLDKYKSTKVIGLFWDQLWRQLAASEQIALWDIPPTEAVANDYELFRSVFDPTLPLLDIGCGTGIQTGFLGSLYDRVIGIDASKTAITQANITAQTSSLKFVQLNVLNEKEVQQFRTQIGDCNVYIRGVLHQIPFENRALFIKHIQILMGNSGVLYMVETAPNIQSFIKTLSDKFSELPVAFKRVLTSHFPPLGVSLDEIHGWFDKANYDLVTEGQTVLATNIILEDNKSVALPAIFALIKTRQK